MLIIASKHCPGCGQNKPIDQFNRDKQTRDGLQWRCKVCNRARNRAYYEANKDKVLARTGAYQRAHPAVWVKAQAKYKTTNRDKMLPKVRARSSAWRAKNRDKDRVASRRWQYNNPDAYSVIQQRRRARQRNAKGAYTTQDWQQLKMQYDYHCLCCGKREPTISLTVDHVIPLILGGTNDISNIQPLCKPCNCSKQALHTTDYRLRWVPHGMSQASLDLE